MWKKRLWMSSFPRTFSTPRRMCYQQYVSSARRCLMRFAPNRKRSWKNVSCVAHKSRRDASPLPQGRRPWPPSPQHRSARRQLLQLPQLRMIGGKITALPPRRNPPPRPRRVPAAPPPNWIGFSMSTACRCKMYRCWCPWGSLSLRSSARVWRL